MGIKAAEKPAPRRIMGADCSTQSFAFSIFQDGELESWGEIHFAGATPFHRLADAQRKIRAFKDQFSVDMVYIESAVYVQNKKTVILLAYAFGAIMAALIDNGAADVEQVSPLEWQRAIGNPPLTKAEKEVINKANPDRSKSWLSNAYREFRKDRTRQWVNNKFGTSIQSDNVTDAIAIGAVQSGLV